VIPPIAGLTTPNPALPLHDRSIALATERRPLGPIGAVLDVQHHVVDVTVAR
jgi:hypothetical protein